MDYKHIQNCKLLPNRTELLKNLPQNAIVAELGVDHGDFSELILKHTTPEKLHLVDLWGSKRYNQDLRQLVEKKFSKQIKGGSVKIDLGLSTEVVKQYPNEYFDWIYIDTDHGYKVTKAELYAYESKVKPGGYIAGHDYIMGNWGKVRYGVIEAVYEFCQDRNWELAYLTMEYTPGIEHPSFCLKKI